MRTVEDYAAIRYAYHVEHKTIRQISRELDIARQTVRKAVETAIPSPYTRTRLRPAPVLGPFKATLDHLLAECARMPRKQRYTIHKMYAAIAAEGYHGSESHVRAYIGTLRQATNRPAAFLPLEFDPGTDAQVDWGEAAAVIADVPRTVQVFVMRLCYSHRTFVMAFPTQRQEAFFLGHVQAFHHFGGVPQRLSYDNLTTAVRRVLEGHRREEQQAFIAFRSHYLFASHFCTVGEGHEKGQVEHGVGFARRNFMVPIPAVESFAALNAHLQAEMARDDARTVDRQPQPIGAMWAHEQPALRALPAREFDCCVTVPATLTPYSQVIFETNRYSVPVATAQRDLVVKAYPFQIDILAQHQRLAQHPRCYDRAQDILDPLHYLPLLEQRPGAFEHAKPIRAWRAHWPLAYTRLLNRLRDQEHEGRGVREFVRILQLHQTYPAALLEQAIALALQHGCIDCDGVLLCLHQIQHPDQLRAALDLTDQPHLAHVGTQPIDLHCYDRLLPGGA
jgi:transposase